VVQEAIQHADVPFARVVEAARARHGLSMHATCSNAVYAHDDEPGVSHSDGVSAGIFMTELVTAYNAAKAGLAEPELPSLPIQYVDFSAWQRARLDGGELHAQREYWRQRLADAPQLLQLPTDFARPAEPSGRGDAVDVEVSPEVAAGLRALAAASGSTMFTMLLTAWQVSVFIPCLARLPRCLTPGACMQHPDGLALGLHSGPDGTVQPKRRCGGGRAASQPHTP